MVHKLIFPLLAFCVIACGAVPAPTPDGVAGSDATGAPTRAPLSERDPSLLALQLAELPDEVSVTEIVNMDESYTDQPDVHAGLVQGYQVSHRTDDWSRAFYNGVFVYGDAAQAKKAYRAILLQTGEEPVVVSEIGTEAAAISREDDTDAGTLHMKMVVWRYDNAAAFLLEATYRSPPPLDELVRLCQLVQSRLE